MALILVFFIFLFLFFYKKKRPVMLLMIGLQILSLLGAFLLDLVYPIEDLFNLFNLLMCGILLSLIVLPWRKIHNIETITIPNPKKVDKMTNVLLAVNLFVFIIFALTVYIVRTMVDDINEFKYTEDTATEFFYSALPFGARPLILAFKLTPLSYFLIPLHFYYLSQSRFKKALFCFVMSLNSVLFGMTFFSRAVYVHYILIYSGMLLLMLKTLPQKQLKAIKKIFTVFVALVTISFISITISRFSEQDNFYSDKISSDSPIQNPVIYGLFDYLAQSTNNGMTVLNDYDFKTFNGQIAFQEPLSILGQYKIIDYDVTKYNQLRRELWPKHYFTFNGYAAYTIYDFGYLGGVIISFIYCIIVIRCRPKKGKTTLIHLFLLTLLIQIPLMAIFYSTLNGLMLAFVFLIPISLYLKFKTS